MEKKPTLKSTEKTLIKEKLLREIEILELEAESKRKKINIKTPYKPAVTIAVVALVIAVLSQLCQILSQYNQSQNQIELEKQKFEYSVILQASQSPNIRSTALALDNYINFGFIKGEKKQYEKLFNEGKLNEIPYANRKFEFNTDSLDLPTVSVNNATSNPCESGPPTGCWNLIAYAKKGDIISVQIYYHNIADTAAIDVAAVLDKSISYGQVHEFSGELTSNNETIAFGKAKIITDKPEKLTYIPGSIRIFPSQSTRGYKIKGEQDIFSEAGLGIGTIESGWNYQGTIVVDYKVGD